MADFFLCTGIYVQYIVTYTQSIHPLHEALHDQKATYIKNFTFQNLEFNFSKFSVIRYGKNFEGFNFQGFQGFLLSLKILSLNFFVERLL